MNSKKILISETTLKNIIRDVILETIACIGGEYKKRIRYLCHLIKEGNLEAIDEASLIMAKYVPPNSILIPIPSHNGKATYTLKLAQFIAKRSKSKVMDLLSSQPREMLYKLKQNGIDPKNINLDFKTTPDPDGTIAKTLSNTRNVILIDNVVSSGITYEQAQNTIKQMYGADSWMLSLGAVENSRYDKGENRVLRSTF
jgi:hypothetical protein